MTPSTLHRSHRPASARTPPPAVWPLLGTVAGTALLMAAVIAWRAAPFDATLAAAAAATGATTLTALALPRVTPRQPHPTKEMRHRTRGKRDPPTPAFSPRPESHQEGSTTCAPTPTRPTATPATPRPEPAR